MRRGLLGQLEGVTSDISELDDLIALIVVPQNEDPIAQTGLGGRRSRHEIRIRRWRQRARAFDSLFAVRVGVATHQEQGQRSGLGFKRQVGHLSIVHIHRSFREWEVKNGRYFCRRLFWQPPMEGP